jgi:hypothetical protein
MDITTAHTKCCHNNAQTLDPTSDKPLPHKVEALFGLRQTDSVGKITMIQSCAKLTRDLELTFLNGRPQRITSHQVPHKLELYLVTPCCYGA